jgi:L-arabinokinase
MGGNVDYTGGLVFQATINEATWAAAQRRDDGRIIFLNPQVKSEGWLERVEYDLASLTTEGAVRAKVNGDSKVRWTAYVLGLFYLLRDKHPEKVQNGANVYIESTVPLNKGVSSSAAIEVAVMKAIAAVYEIPLRGVELAEACQWAENVIAESGCGIMDQAASVLGDEGYMLPLLCQSCVPRPLVKLPDGLRCWGIDCGVRHAVTGAEYEAARAGAFIGYSVICERENLDLLLDESGRIPRYIEPRWNGYLSNVPVSEFRSRYEEQLPLLVSGVDILTSHRIHPDPFSSIRPEQCYRVRACTRYAIEENQRIELFVELARGAQSADSEKTFQLMGELMFQSHWSYSECGLGCDATDLLISFVREECATGNLYGAKITGGGGGGTVAVLGREDAEEALRRVVNRYGEARGIEPCVFDGSSMGADRFGVHVLEAQA